MTTIFNYDQYEEEDNLTSTTGPSIKEEFTNVRIVVIIIYSIIFLLGVSGNGMVIWISGFKMKKTPSTIWFLNLAIADFVLTVFLPFYIAQVSLNYHWPFGRVMCKLCSAILVVNMYTSVFLLTCISIDRCASVFYPVQMQNYRTNSLIALINLTVWVLGFVMSIPMLLFRNTYTFDNVTYCLKNFSYFAPVLDQKKSHSTTVIISFLFGFLIPFFIITICYANIILRLKRKHNVKSNKPFRIMLAVIVAFFVCWFPYHVFSFIEIELQKPGFVFKTGMAIASCLIFLNSCINPFLYVFVGQEFKKKMWQSIFKSLENAFAEETLVNSRFSTKRSLSQCSEHPALTQTV
uniref:G-protein coupled receptors family 1 profile domain-containing protein n=2 Tax=Latimeria chalumnae TaxID=7897 RepID=H3AT99_LATCH